MFYTGIIRESAHPSKHNISIMTWARKCPMHPPPSMIFHEWYEIVQGTLISGII